jgi:hypothetical protein
MTDTIFALPPLWIASGTHQRKLVASILTITFSNNEQGCYLQVLSQNVRVVLDGVTNPVVSGNDVGFVLRPTDPPVTFTGKPGDKILLIQETATAVVQYQMLTLSGLYR